MLAAVLLVVLALGALAFVPHWWGWLPDEPQRRGRQHVSAQAPVPPLGAVPVASVGARSTPAVASTPADRGHARAGLTPVDMQRFALNALIVPLLDDSEPARWTDVAVPGMCGPGTRITVDGRPLEPGAEVPVTSFTLRWTMDHCSPLGFDSVELTGEVELVVFREDLGLGAVVMASGLRVDSALGRAGLPERFAAYTAFIPEPAASRTRGPRR